MDRYIKPTLESGNPVWELPVRERLLVGNPDWVHPRAKFHCFVYGDSLCGKYGQDTDFFETDIESREIEMCPEIACKKCLKKWKNRYV